MTPSRTATPVPLPEPQVTTLSNGVTLLNAPSASRNVGVFLIVRAGSRDETAETAGLAHYLEHMFFKGTERRPTARQINREVDRLGAATNAYTDTEEVGYFAEGPATALHQLADIITDMLSRPLFAAEEVERERNVVLQELSARLADPDGWIFDRLGTVAFGGDQPMSWSAAGLPRVIEKATRDQLLGYHRSFYAPVSMCLVVAGGATLDPEKADRLLRDVPTAKPRPREPARWGQGDRYTGNVRPVTESEEPQTKMAVALPGIPALDEERTALSLMSFILGGGMSSRLFHTVRERRGLAYAIFSFHEAFEDTGVFVISTGTRPRDAVKAVRLSFRELRRMAAQPVPAAELAAAKSAMIGRLLRSTETAIASARFFGGRWRARLPLETPDQRADAIARVTAAEVQRVAERIAAGIDQVRVAFVGPEDQGEALLEAATDRRAAA
ncbi:MAG TPA: pitrilysin family protein [Candidatus Binatia bacterium]|nr:pitrilysin family protein [Candidatus Binatia bacterium]